MSKPLTARGVAAIKPDPAKRLEVPDGGLPALYLVVQPSGRKSWAVRYRFGGKTKKLTLGRHPMVSLADAREAARDALAKVDVGEDPAAKRRAVEPDRDLVRVVVTDFIARHASKNRTVAETERILNREVLSRWGDRRVAEIEHRDVLELIDGIADRGAPVMANRVLATVRKLFNWAVSRGIVANNPAAGVKPPAREVKRERVLSDAEIAALWRAADRQGWPFGPLWKVLLLTAARREEVTGMRWSEIAGDAWVIPADRSKNGREHHLPMSKAAVELLDGLPRVSDDLVFTTRGTAPVSGFSKAKARLDALMAEELGEDVAPWRLHDLRRTAASGMARAGARLEVIERVLNHSSGSFGGIVGVYQRHSYADEMRNALDAWSGLIDRIVSGSEVRVIEFRRC